MSQNLRAAIQPSHILQAEIHSFQNITIEFLKPFPELIQLDKDKGQLVCKQCMRLLFIKTINCLHLRIPLVLIYIKIQNIDYINRAKSIIRSSGINLISHLERRIVNRTFNIGSLLTSLHLNDDSRAVICLAEHVINRILLLPVHGLHFFVHKLQVYNRPVINYLIQELDHHILTGLLSKDQLEHIIVKQVSILKLVLHKFLFLMVSFGHYGPDQKFMLRLLPLLCPQICEKIKSFHTPPCRFFFFFNKLFLNL